MQQPLYNLKCNNGTVPKIITLTMQVIGTVSPFFLENEYKIIMPQVY